MAQYPVLSSSSSLGLTRVERRAAKEIALSRAASSVLAARAEAKIDAIADVTERALLNAGDLSCIEQVLVARSPHAAGRFGYITNQACVAMGGVVTQMARRL
jgi:hypothetical protein